MLIIFSLSTKRKDIIKTFAKSHMIARNGNTRELSYNHKAFLDVYKAAYFSRVSVLFIAVRYFLSVFGEVQEANRWVVACFIVVLTIVLIVVTKIVIDFLMRKNNHPITNEELENVGAEPDIESISAQVIDGIFYSSDIKTREK